LQYDDCVALCSDSRPYEAAYALYRLGQHDAVLQMAAEKGDASTQWQWLQAQAQFRSGNFDAAKCTYSALRDASAAHDAQVEATVNYTAALIEAGSAIPPSIKPEGGADFEVAFNVATGLLRSGDAAGAGAALQAALAGARAALLADGLTAVEAEAELLPLLLQSAVAQQYSGDAAAATAVLRSAQRAAPRRSQASYVAAVNTAVAAGSRDLFAAFTAVKAALAAADDSKLSSTQRHLLQVNRALLLAHTSKGGEALALAGGLLAQGGGAHAAHLQALLAAMQPAKAGDSTHERVAAAAALAASGSTAEAAAALQAAAASAQEAQLPAVLAAYVHWALQAGDSADAVAAAAVGILGGRPAGPAVVAARAAVVRGLHAAAAAQAAAAVLESGSIGTDAGSALLATMVHAAAGSVVALPPAPSGAVAPPLASLLTGPLPWVGTTARGGAAVAPPALPTTSGKDSSVAGGGVAAGGTELPPAEARAARRQAARLRRRAKLRATHMEKLRNKAVYRSGAAIPKPDPERWMPFKARSYDRFGNLKRRPKAGAASAAYKNTGSSQGLAGGDTAKAASALDAKAAADAKEAAGGAGAAAGVGGVKGSTKAAPKVAAGLGKKKKRGKRR